MLLTFCLMFGILATGTSAMQSGVPAEPGARMLYPVMLRESNASRTAVLLTLINNARAEAGLQALQLDDRLGVPLRTTHRSWRRRVSSHISFRENRIWPAGWVRKFVSTRRERMSFTTSLSKVRTTRSWALHCTVPTC